MPQAAWPDAGTLVTIASLITAFAVAILAFRIERELQMLEQDMPAWIPWADRMLVAAAWVSMLLVVLPLLAFPSTSVINRVVPPAACGAAALFVVGYPLAILAHYRFIFSRRAQTEPRTEPAEPAERVIVIATVVAATVVSLWIAYTHAL